MYLLHGRNLVLTFPSPKYQVYQKNMVIQKRHGNSTNVSQMLIEEFGRTTDMFLAWCSNTKFEIGLVDFYRESFVSR